MSIIVQELCESRGGRPGLSVLTSLLVSVDVKIYFEPCFGIGDNLSLMCQLTSEDIKHELVIIISYGFPRRSFHTCHCEKEDKKA